MPNELELYHVTVRNGQGRREPLLFIHGYGCSQRVWEPLLCELAGEWPSILFDLPGHGEAHPSVFDPLRHATLDGFADDILAVCDAVPSSRPLAVVAHSVGCNLAMRVAIRRPELFSFLFLLGPSPCFLRNDDYDGGFGPGDIDEILRLLEVNPALFAHNLSVLVAGAEGSAASWLEGSFCSVDPLCASLFARATFLCDDRDLLDRVRTPAIVLQHAEDALVPVAAGRFMVERMPDAKLMLLPAKGHAAHLTAPDQVTAAIRQVLA